MTDTTRAEQVTPHLVQVCFNPHEPFYWEADQPEEPCPGDGCENDPHVTYVSLPDLTAWLDEQIEKVPEDQQSEAFRKVRFFLAEETP